MLFGILTTAVNYIIYFTCTGLIRMNWTAANILAWLGAVLFAYLTNRTLVFHSKERNGLSILREAGLFLGARLLSLGIDMLIMFLCMDLAGLGSWEVAGIAAGELAAKTVAQATVILSNYAFSKWFIFRKKD